MSFNVQWLLGLFFIIITFDLAALEHKTIDAARAVDRGREIYRSGRTGSGKPLLAVVSSDVLLPESQRACANCHARSGLGYSEGNTISLPLTGPKLFQAVEIAPKWTTQKRTEGAGTRPAYSDKTLAMAIRTGTDSAGRQLDQMMPRYQISDQDMADLTAYLKTLGASPALGLTKKEIHFATVVSEDVDLQQRDAMLDVIKAYVKAKNGLTRREDKRSRYAPAHKEWDYTAYRKWNHHLWTLRGPRDSWGEQLKAYYQQQPVFAMVSGMVSGSWLPVHQFCEDKQLPSLFPITDLPVINEADFYTVYFNKGKTLEASVLAKYFNEKGFFNTSSATVQVYRDTEQGRTTAQAFRTASKHFVEAKLSDLKIEGSEPLVAEFWKQFASDHGNKSWVLWLTEKDLAGLNMSVNSEQLPTAIVLSASFAPDYNRQMVEQLQDKILITYPYALPNMLSAREKIVEIWLRSKKKLFSDPQVQVSSFFPCVHWVKA